MKSFCFCFKRDRDTYSLSSSSIHYTGANTTKPTVTIAPLPLSSDIPSDTVGSHYEKILDTISDKNTSDRRSSIEDNGYAKITPPRVPFSDDTGLYATIDKTKKAKNRIKTDDTTVQQGSSSISATISSPNSRQSQLTINSDQQPPLPSPSPQVYMNTMNGNNNVSHNTRHPHYDEVITRESLQHRTQRLENEQEQNRPDQQLHEIYYTSRNSEQSARTNSDIYAEIANGSASGTIHSNSQSQFHYRPSNGNGIDDDSSERYATVTDTNNPK